jgi:VanZ family protein
MSARRIALMLIRTVLVISCIATAVVLHLPAPSGVSADARGTVRSAWSAAGDAADAASPFVPDVVTPLVSDKTIHFGLFVVLAALWASSRTLSGRWNMRGAMMIVGILSLYAGVGELAQIAEGRIADWGDWLANVLGAIAGVGVVALARTAARRLAPVT